MRFKNYAPRAALIISSVYILQLGYEGDLDLYIHPRYEIFTITMAAVALAMLTFDFIFSDHMNSGKTTKWLSKTPIVVMLVSGFFLPAQVLSSATVTQRATDSGSIVAATDVGSPSQLFVGSSKGLKLIDWSGLLEREKDESFYVNKPAKISGFIYDANLGEDTFLLARFILTCCAVDAQPIGVPVRIENWNESYSQDQWVELEGEFKLAQNSMSEEIALIPSKINTIEVPEDPYAN